MIPPHVAHLQNEPLAGRQLDDFAKIRHVVRRRLFEMQVFSRIQDSLAVPRMIRDPRFDGNHLNVRMREQLRGVQNMDALRLELVADFGILFAYAYQLPVGGLLHDLQLCRGVRVSCADEADSDWFRLRLRGYRR